MAGLAYQADGAEVLDGAVEAALAHTGAHRRCSWRERLPGACTRLRVADLVPTVKLDPDAIVSEDKVRRYLLTPRDRNDKSAFFAQGGYSQERWQQLALDIRERLLPGEARLSQRTEFGDLYTVSGVLAGPNGATLRVVSVWIVEHSTGVTRLVTAYPRRQRSRRDERSEGNEYTA